MQVAQEVTQRLMDEGRIIEAGWNNIKAVLSNTSQDDIMRRMFYAGAHHVFYSMMTSLDPCEEFTGADEARFANIDRELRQFIDELETWTS